MSKSPIWKGTRLKVWKRDNYRCTYCGRDCDAMENASRPTIDHIIPRSMGGSSRIENLTTACMSCNARKKNRSAEWLRERLEAA